MIELKNITKKFKNTIVLKTIHLEIEKTKKFIQDPNPLTNPLLVAAKTYIQYFYKEFVFIDYWESFDLLINEYSLHHVVLFEFDKHNSTFSLVNSHSVS